MSTQQITVSNSVGLGGFAFLILATLKLTGFITWSWWWITCPLWGPAVGLITGFTLIFLGAMIATSGERRRARRAR